MPEGLSASEVGKEIAEHAEHVAARSMGTGARHERRDRPITIAEAILLSAVTLLAA